MKIIFVCTGNTCRSPMAEGIMKKLCDEHGIIAEIKSAGIFVNDIDGVAENAVLAAAEHGIDISAHTPTQLTPDMMSAADIIAPMTEAQADLLIGAGVENDKIYRFAHPIADPYMGTRERYSACFDELYDAIKTMIKDLFDDTTTD